MNSINQTYSISSLTREEVQTILESLLFASSVDICASFYKEESLAMFDVAKKIRKMFPEILLENVNITPIVDENGQEVYHDEHTETILGYFPEIQTYNEIKF
jgi:hypothetical protein